MKLRFELAMLALLESGLVTVSELALEKVMESAMQLLSVSMWLLDLPPDTTYAKHQPQC